MEIFDSDYSVAEDIIRGLSLDELVHAKNDNPNDTFWGEYIEIKKEQTQYPTLFITPTLSTVSEECLV